AAAFLVSTIGGSVYAAADPPVASDQITMNFQNVDIPVLAKFISEITGKNFIIDESVRGKVTIISPTKVTPQEAYQAFQSALEIKGFTTVTVGKSIKIIPARNVRSDAPLTEAQQPGETRGDEYVTRMVKLQNVDAASLVNVIQPMVSHDGLVAAYPEDNTLIITDDAYNVERLLEIIGHLDVHGEQQNVAVIPLKLAFAGEVAPEIEQIMSARGRRSGAAGHRGGGAGGERFGDGVQGNRGRADQFAGGAGGAAADAADPGDRGEVGHPAAQRDRAHPRVSAQECAGAGDGGGAQQPAERRRQSDHAFTHHRQGLAGLR